MSLVTRRGWCVVDLLGHERLVGLLTVESGGTHTLEVPEVTRDREDATVVWAPRVVTFYAQAVYQLRWCSEQTAREALSKVSTSMLWPPAPPEVKPPAFEAGMWLRIGPNGVACEPVTPVVEGLPIVYGFPVDPLVHEYRREWLTRWDQLNLEEVEFRGGAYLYAAGAQVWPPVQKPVLRVEV